MTKNLPTKKCLPICSHCKTEEIIVKIQVLNFQEPEISTSKWALIPTRTGMQTI
jgi:hypothetical protein